MQDAKQLFCLLSESVYMYLCFIFLSALLRNDFAVSPEQTTSACVGNVKCDASCIPAGFYRMDSDIYKSTEKNRQ